MANLTANTKNYGQITLNPYPTQTLNLRLKIVSC